MKEGLSFVAVAGVAATVVVLILMSMHVNIDEPVVAWRLSIGAVAFIIAGIVTMIWKMLKRPKKP